MKKSWRAPRMAGKCRRGGTGAPAHGFSTGSHANRKLLISHRYSLLVLTFSHCFAYKRKKCGGNTARENRFVITTDSLLIRPKRSFQYNWRDAFLMETHACIPKGVGRDNLLREKFITPLSPNPTSIYT